MAQNRFYSSTAVETALNGGISNSTTTVIVTSVAGFPSSYPYTLVIAPDTELEEVITVTAATGVVLTVLRGQDGTAGVSHDPNTPVVHGVSARDFNEPQAHIAAASGVHGITGAVVGTTDTQTLTGKTISGVSNTLQSVPQTALNPAPVGLLVDTASAQSLSNKSFIGAVLDSASTLGGVSGTALASLAATAPDLTPHTYTPTLSVGSTSIGTGGQTYGRYFQVGKLVVCFLGVVCGSGTVNFDGAFSLPIPARNANGDVGVMLGVCEANDVSAGAFYSGYAKAAGSWASFNGSNGLAWHGPSVPFAWAINDTLRATLIYEIA